MARKRRGGSASQKAKFRKAAKSCKGKPLRSFRACMKTKLRK